MKKNSVEIKTYEAISKIARKVTEKMANSVCFAIGHQEKMPDNSQKLRKF